MILLDLTLFSWLPIFRITYEIVIQCQNELTKTKKVKPEKTLKRGRKWIN